MDNILKTVIVNMLVKSGDPVSAVDMWEENIPADRILYNSFLMACTKAGRLDIGRKIHAHMTRNNFDMVPEALSSLIKLYSKCGEPERVMELWNLISKRYFCF
eukprot:Phypoly_transcript_30947.p1 GENE.Phypoly_transcript_30947~~Phypoly_transcript_30947.p1  ORF type:complete len:103 (+),score=5.54 Phypoly_transcript_30947:61-369(+)